MEWRHEQTLTPRRRRWPQARPCAEHGTEPARGYRFRAAHLEEHPLAQLRGRVDGHAREGGVQRGGVHGRARVVGQRPCEVARDMQVLQLPCHTPDGLQRRGGLREGHGGGRGWRGGAWAAAGAAAAAVGAVHGALGVGERGAAGAREVSRVPRGRTLHASRAGRLAVVAAAEGAGGRGWLSGRGRRWGVRARGGLWRGHGVEGVVRDDAEELVQAHALHGLAHDGGDQVLQIRTCQDASRTAVVVQRLQHFVHRHLGRWGGSGSFGDHESWPFHRDPAARAWPSR
mmetsp:Transcript_1877/g.5601  ORF Transcript_1877/g.5601 Transcript_1877/m.5601 type:complete len:286 (-) Transcript_1877:632-1489(-)